MNGDALAEVGPAGRGAGRLAGWIALAGSLAAISYAGRIAGEAPAPDVLYLWSTVASGFVQYTIVFALVVAIARGLDRQLLALRTPSRPRWAVGQAVIALLLILVTAGILGRFLDAGEEQGLVPQGWDGSRALPFLANAVLVVVVAPWVEELLYRGLGIGVLSPFVGTWPSVFVAGVAFGLAHGLVLGLPVLSIFGIVLGWLRLRTGSVMPGMVVHAVFNGLALVVAVAT